MKNRTPSSTEIDERTRETAAKLAGAEGELAMREQQHAAATAHALAYGAEAPCESPLIRALSSKIKQLNDAIPLLRTMRREVRQRELAELIPAMRAQRDAKLEEYKAAAERAKQKAAAEEAKVQTIYREAETLRIETSRLWDEQQALARA